MVPDERLDASATEVTYRGRGGAAVDAIKLATALRERYAIDSILGRGGMGVVLRARDVALDRVVAIKLLAVKADAEAAARFVREGRVMAAVEHPSLVRIFDLGVADGVPFIVSEFLGGGTLKAQMTHAMDARAAAALLIPCMRAVAELHRCGVLHRDIKPDNILLDAGGRPRIADLGLASWSAERSLTATGAVLGTPRYMAPEQLAGDPGAASDQHAFGLVYYEMVCGRLAHRAESLPELLDAIANGRIEPPSRIGIPLPPAVEDALMRALALDPQRRFPDVAAFADALEVALDLEPRTDAGPEPAAEPAPARATTRPMSRPTAGQARRSGAVARASAVTPVPTSVPARRPPVLALAAALGAVALALAIGAFARRGGGPRGTAASAGSASPWESVPPSVVATSPAPEAAVRLRPVLTPLSLPAPALACAWSPDGKMIAVVCRDRMVRIVDPAARRILRTNATGAVSVEPAVLCFAPDGHVISGQLGREIFSWRFSGTPILRRVSELAGPCRFTANLALVAGRGRDGQLRVEDAVSAQVRWLAKTAAPSTALALSPYDDELASAEGPDVMIREMSTGHVVRRLPAPSAPVRALAYARDGRRLVAACEGTLAAWALPAGTAEPAHALGRALAQLEVAPDRRLTALVPRADAMLELVYPDEP